MHKKLRIQTLIIGTLFFLASMGAVIGYCWQKVVIIENIAGDQVRTDDGEASSQQGVQQKENRLTMQEDKTATNYLCVPLSSELKAEQVRIENHYMDCEIWIYITAAPDNFYEGNALTGNLEKVVGGSFEEREKETILKLVLDGIYECKTILERGYLFLEFMLPGEIFDKIVVIDAGHGGSDTGFQYNDTEEKELTLDIVKRLMTQMDNTDVKVYYTRTEDKAISDERRAWLANEVKADMLISIHADMNEDDLMEYGTTTLYNETFFIPGFGSIELADMLEREVVTAISGKAIGLHAAGEKESVVSQAEVPAAMIKLGFLTNRQEAILLEREDYRDKIVTGIYNAIMKAYEVQAGIQN